MPAHDQYPKQLNGYTLEGIIDYPKDAYYHDYEPDTVVWLAQKHGKQYALKKKNNSRFARNELRILEKIPKHPNLTELTEHFRYKGDHIIIQPLAGNQDLPNYLNNIRVLRFFDYLIDVSEGLGAVHGEGLVHNDIKPRNIRIDDNKAVILDFELARKEGEILVINTFFHGLILHHWPPEDKRKFAVRSRSYRDLYSVLDMTDYILSRHRSKKYHSLLEVEKDDLIAQVGQVLHRHKHEQRPQVAAELSDILNDLRESRAVKDLDSYFLEKYKKIYEMF